MVDKRLSNLDLVRRVNSWPYLHKDQTAYKAQISEFYYFIIEGFPTPFGYAHIPFIHSMTWPGSWTLDHEKRHLTLHALPNDFATRTQILHDTLHAEHTLGSSPALAYWSPENFAVVDAQNTHVANMPASAVDLFGIKTFAVHMIAYTKVGEEWKYWVSRRRRRNKMNFPGMLNNSVGGSVSSEEKPVDCIVRETREEAGVPEEYTRAHVKPCGTLSYQMTQTDRGEPGCQHQLQYLYEMELPPGMRLKPFDGEVEEFTLKSIGEVREALEGGGF